MAEAGPSQNESLLACAYRLKAEDRLRLKQLRAGEAQVEVDAVLVSLGWSIADPTQLIWPGDLGDDPEEPRWMSQP